MSTSLPRRVSWLVVALTALLCADFAAAPDIVHMKRAPSHPDHLPTARFSHIEHFSFGCYACHPGLFSSPREAITHDDMKRGQACGACHDGTVARSIPQLGCKSCHAK